MAKAQRVPIDEQPDLFGGRENSPGQRLSWKITPADHGTVLRLGTSWTRKSLSKATRRSYLRAIRVVTHWMHAYGIELFSDVTPAHAAAFKEDLLSVISALEDKQTPVSVWSPSEVFVKSPSQNSVNSLVAQVRTVFANLEELREIEKSPFASTKAGRTDTRRPKTQSDRLGKNEIAVLERAIRRSTWRQPKKDLVLLAIALLQETGLKPGRILTLQLSDISKSRHKCAYQRATRSGKTQPTDHLITPTIKSENPNAHITYQSFRSLLRNAFDLGAELERTAGVESSVFERCKISWLRGNLVNF